MKKGKIEESIKKVQVFKVKIGTGDTLIIAMDEEISQKQYGHIVAQLEKHFKDKIKIVLFSGVTINSMAIVKIAKNS